MDNYFSFGGKREPAGGPRALSARTMCLSRTCACLRSLDNEGCQSERANCNGEFDGANVHRARRNDWTTAMATIQGCVRPVILCPLRVARLPIVERVQRSREIY